LFLLQIDRNGNGYIEVAELKNALDIVGFKFPQWKVRQMAEEVDKDRNGRLSFDEFRQVRDFHL
jgi:Ca2+-binding EF-hand superfamily protein